MNESNAIAGLSDALNDAAAVDQPVNFWLRDDDAVDPGEALDRLLTLTRDFSVPLTLAVIPVDTGSALADRLDATEHVAVAVHGWSHTNHAAANEKKQELGNHRPPSDVLAELHRGFTHLAQLHSSRFVPLLVPPWNRISIDIVERLHETGFKGVSTFGPEKSGELLSINTQVDIIDWRGTRGGRSVVELVAEIITQMREGRTCIGILTHHLVHDEAAWHFLQQLFEATSEHPGARWCSISDLLSAWPQRLARP